jgi:hypothetical protein
VEVYELARRQFGLNLLLLKTALAACEQHQRKSHRDCQFPLAVALHNRLHDERVGHTPKLSKADYRAKISQNEARRRKEVALATIREMEAAEKAGRLIPADQVEAAWAEIRNKIKGAVLRIPVNCAAKVAAVLTGLLPRSCRTRSKRRPATECERT